MANWSQKKLLMTIGGSAVVVCLAAVGGVYWAQGLIEELDVQVKAKQEEIAAADRKITQIPVVEKDVVILRENLDEYVKILPDNDELTAFVRMLNQFERQSGIVGQSLLKKNQRRGKDQGKFTPIEYSYEMTATLWQGLKFVNLIENYQRFVSITDFSLTAGGGGRDEERRDGEVVHRIQLTMVTYTYNKAGGGKEVEIPGYADKKEQLREEIWKRMQAIRVDIEPYEHKGVQGRRDIFVDPRERGDLPNDGPSPAEQLKLLERYIGQIGTLKEMLGRMRAPDTTLFEQYSLEKRFKTELGKMLAEVEGDSGRLSYAPYKLRWAKEVATQLDELRAQTDSPVAGSQAPKDPYLPEADIEQLVAQMAADCNNGQLEQARERYEAVAERVEVPATDPRHDIAVVAKAWHVKATTAIDFKGLDLKVQGVVVNRDGRSGVLLNGEVYEEGDFVADDLLVKLVEEEQVWFVFRGLTLVRTM